MLSGLGRWDRKTSFAKACVKKKGQPYFITGSNRDIFQGYNGKHPLILDELRAKIITYPNLLSITDSFSISNQVMASCQYHNKLFACDVITITTSYTPEDLYYKQFDRQADKSAVAIFSPPPRLVCISRILGLNMSVIFHS